MNVKVVAIVQRRCITT